MIAWLKRNASAVEAGSALATAMVAIAALVGVKLQIDASDRAQALQSARAAYLAQQALSVQYPKYADPEDACALLASSDGAAYEAYVTHLLFTAEQTLATQNGWEQTFEYEMQPHQTYICGNLEQINATTELHDLIGRFAATHCATVPACPAG
jgi:hypothetical protein